MLAGATGAGRRQGNLVAGLYAITGLLDAPIHAHLIALDELLHASAREIGKVGGEVSIQPFAAVLNQQSLYWACGHSH